MTIWRLLKSFANDCVFGVEDFQALFPQKSPQDLRVLLSRMVKNQLLERVTNGIFFVPENFKDLSSILYKTAAKLRSRDFNYLSLESVLSEAGVISQVMFNYLTVMTTGRAGTINCGRFGTIEFIHTQKSGEKLRDLSLNRYGFFRAGTALALQDMRRTRRNFDLINENL